MKLCHPTDDDFGRYLLGISTDNTSNLEEHLISCPDCVNRAEAVESYFESIRGYVNCPGVFMKRRVSVAAFRPEFREHRSRQAPS